MAGSPHHRRALTEAYHLPTTGRVDRDARLIYGVKVIGHDSKNKRTYTDDCLRNACPMYEGQPVYVGHPPKAGMNRDREEPLGVLENVRARPDGLYADLRYQESHPLTRSLIEAAERNPRLWCLSHNAHGDAKDLGEGREEIHEILEVHSVDLVRRGATTRGLFEGIELREAQTPYEAQRQAEKDAHAGARAAIDTHLSGGVPTKAQQDRRNESGDRFADAVRAQREGRAPRPAPVTEATEDEARRKTVDDEQAARDDGNASLAAGNHPTKAQLDRHGEARAARIRGQWEGYKQLERPTPVTESTPTRRRWGQALREAEPQLTPEEAHEKANQDHRDSAAQFGTGDTPTKAYVDRNREAHFRRDASYMTARYGGEDRPAPVQYPDRRPSDHEDEDREHALKEAAQTPQEQYHKAYSDQNRTRGRLANASLSGATPTRAQHDAADEADARYEHHLANAGNPAGLRHAPIVPVQEDAEKAYEPRSTHTLTADRDVDANQPSKFARDSINDIRRQHPQVMRRAFRPHEDQPLEEAHDDRTGGVNPEWLKHAGTQTPAEERGPMYTHRDVKSGQVSPGMPDYALPAAPGYTGARMVATPEPMQEAHDDRHGGYDPVLVSGERAAQAYTHADVKAGEIKGGNPPEYAQAGGYRSVTTPKGSTLYVPMEEGAAEEYENAQTRTSGWDTNVLYDHIQTSHKPVAKGNIDATHNILGRRPGATRHFHDYERQPLEESPRKSETAANYDEFAKHMDDPKRFEHQDEFGKRTAHSYTAAADDIEAQHTQPVKESDEDKRSTHTATSPFGAADMDFAADAGASSQYHQAVKDNLDDANQYRRERAFAPREFSPRETQVKESRPESGTRSIGMRRRWGTPAAVRSDAHQRAEGLEEGREDYTRDRHLADDEADAITRMDREGERAIRAQRSATTPAAGEYMRTHDIKSGQPQGGGYQRYASGLDESADDPRSTHTSTGTAPHPFIAPPNQEQKEAIDANNARLSRQGYRRPFRPWDATQPLEEADEPTAKGGGPAPRPLGRAPRPAGGENDIPPAGEDVPGGHRAAWLRHEGRGEPAMTDHDADTHLRGVAASWGHGDTPTPRRGGATMRQPPDDATRLKESGYAPRPKPGPNDIPPQPKRGVRENEEGPDMESGLPAWRAADRRIDTSHGQEQRQAAYNDREKEWAKFAQSAGNHGQPVTAGKTGWNARGEAFIEADEDDGPDMASGRAAWRAAHRKAETAHTNAERLQGHGDAVKHHDKIVRGGERWPWQSPAATRYDARGDAVQEAAGDDPRPAPAEHEEPPLTKDEHLANAQRDEHLANETYAQGSTGADTAEAGRLYRASNESRWLGYGAGTRSGRGQLGRTAKTGEYAESAPPRRWGQPRASGVKEAWTPDQIKRLSVSGYGGENIAHGADDEHKAYTDALAYHGDSTHTRGARFSQGDHEKVEPLHESAPDTIDSAAFARQLLEGR